MSMAAIGISLGTMALSYGLSQASQPKPLNLKASSKELSDTEAALLPMQRQMEALAQQGGKGVINDPTGVLHHTEQQQFAIVPGGNQLVPYVPAEWAPGGRYNLNGTTSITPSLQTKEVEVPGLSVDFTGLGTADVEGAVARKMAEVQLKLSQKYDSQFIDQALAQEKLADPESFAARDKMSELIQGQIARPLNSPVSDLLDKQVSDQVKAAKAGTLDPETQAILDKATTEALAARGGSGGQAGDFSAPLTTGFEGEARRAAAAKAGTGWLASGQTPEDIAYRREQQNLANLSAEVQGKTPQSQFGALKQAQQGPTPVQAGAPLTQLPGGIGQTAAGGAIAAQGAQASQANPWMAGLTTLLNIGSVAGKAGWKPGGP